MARIYTDEAAGLCLGKPSCAGFSNPSASELARDCENPSLILLRKLALLLHLAQKSLRENVGLRLASKRGDVVKKHPQAGLQVSFP